MTRVGNELQIGIRIWLEKMLQLVKGVLLDYKHFAEIGEKRVPIQALRQKYRKLAVPALQQV